MENILSHKIELKPTFKQEQYLKQACGVSRFAWNWALAEWKRLRDLGVNTSGMNLKKNFNAIKGVEYPWMYLVTKYASQQPFIFLQKAFNDFFKNGKGYPKFKKKGVHDSFYIGNDHFKIEGKKCKLPKLDWIKLRECLGFTGKIMSVTISRVADKWFVSVGVKMNITPNSFENQEAVGVDLGINTLATLSNGTKIEGSKPLKKMEGKLVRLSRALSRKIKGSKNWYKFKKKLARVHYRISCIRKDVLHKLTTMLTRRYSVIVIEDLNVKGMMQNGNLAKAISDMGFFEFRRQLDYKSITSGSIIIIADRWFPSTKLCSKCGTKNPHILLSDRVFKCVNEICGFIEDRDVNAGLNLRALAFN